MRDRSWNIVRSAIVAVFFAAILTGPVGTAAQPVPGDVYEPNDSAFTATPIVADGTVRTQYFDAESAPLAHDGADYLSFHATAEKLYKVVLEKGSYGSFARLRIVAGDGTDLSHPGDHLVYGSIPGSETVTVWASASRDETLCVVVDLMGVSPGDALIPYYLTLTEYAAPVIEGTVRDPKTGLPVAGSLVRAYQGPYIPDSGMPPYWYRLDQTTTGADGRYRLVITEPGRVWLRFDDTTGGRIGEWYKGASFMQDTTVLDCTSGTHLTGVNGQLRQPAHLVFRAIASGTTSPLSGAWLSVWSDAPHSFTGPDGWSGFTDTAGVWRIDVDPRRSYRIVGETADMETPSMRAGYRLVSLSPASISVADGRTITVTATYSASLSHDVPGAPVEMPSTVSAYLRSSRINAVYRTALTRGHTYRFWLTGSSGTDFDLGLYGPGTVDMENADTIVAASVHHGSSSESITYYAEEDGEYYAEVLASGASGAFTLRMSDLSDLDPNGDIPGAFSRTVPFTFTGSLKRGTNEGDVCDVALEAGVPVTFRLSGTSGSGAFNLFAPGTTAVFGPDHPVAVIALPGTGSRSLTFTPSESGVYHGFVGTPDSSMSYSMRAYTPPTAQASLTTPSSVSSVRRGSSFRVTGYLKPRHTSGSKAVTLFCYRLQSGSWVLRKTVQAKVANSGSSSRYSLSISLPYTGRWKIRAYHSDTGHAESYSGSRYVTSK